MLELRPGCECGDKDLPPEATDALICSFKCTFCAECAEQIFAGLCPNCGGELVPRPRRPAAKLLHHPAPMTRSYNPGSRARTSRSDSAIGPSIKQFGPAH